MRALCVLLFSSLTFALPAVAQERSFNFALGAGVGAAPDYIGSDNYSGMIVPTFTFGSLKWGAIDAGNGVRGVPDNGISVEGTFRVLDQRTAADNPELAGLADLDAALEIGLGLVYQQTNWMAFGDLRKGVVGHSSVTGTLGADLILRPSDRWKFAIGPRVNFGDDEFADAYFGVGAATTNFGAHIATGGALSAGVQATGSYYFDDKWSLDGGISYEKLLGDAADSPITMRGSEDQWRVGLGLSRVFNLNF